MTSDKMTPDPTTPGVAGGLRCPACNSVDTDVTDTRTRNGNRLIRRRRRCKTCDHCFTTYELDADALRALQQLPETASIILRRATQEIADLTEPFLGGQPLGTSGSETENH